jgi:hypothetical protein
MRQDGEKLDCTGGAKPSLIGRTDDGKSGFLHP